jgi:hypothetical protein
MKNLLLILLIALSGCSKPQNEIVGVWQPKSKFYSATYQLELQNNQLVGKVIYYDDGTTTYKQTGTEKDIFLKNVTYKNDEFVDSFSGATTPNPDITLKHIHKDTLKVSTKILNSVLTEFWIRKN